MPVLAQISSGTASVVRAGAPASFAVPAPKPVISVPSIPPAVPKPAASVDPLNLRSRFATIVGREPTAAELAYLGSVAGNYTWVGLDDHIRARYGSPKPVSIPPIAITEKVTVPPPPPATIVAKEPAKPGTFAAPTPVTAPLKQTPIPVPAPPRATIVPMATPNSTAAPVAKAPAPIPFVAKAAPVLLTIDKATAPVKTATTVAPPAVAPGETVKPAGANGTPGMGVVLAVLAAAVAGLLVIEV